MEDRVMNSRIKQLWDQFEQYCREVEAIQNKIQNHNLSQEKKERIVFRLQDLEVRLIPQLVNEIQAGLMKD